MRGQGLKKIVETGLRGEREKGDIQTRGGEKTLGIRKEKGGEGGDDGRRLGRKKKRG